MDFKERNDFFDVLTLIGGLCLFLFGMNVMDDSLERRAGDKLSAIIGIAYYMFGKTNKKKDTGSILLGFAVLMFGMDIMSDAVSGLRDVPEFRELFIMFKNPTILKI